MGLFRKTDVAALEARGDVGRLLRALDDPDDPVRRRSAALALGRLGDRRAFEPLLEFAQGPFQPMHQAAVEVLGVLGDPRAVEPLISILRASGHSYLPRTQSVAAAAATALGRLRDGRAVQALVEMASGEHVGATIQAACHQALPEIGADAVEPLMDIARAARDLAGADVRCEAVRVFSVLRDERSVPLLIELLETERICRASVVGALGVQGDARAAGPLFAALLRVRFPDRWRLITPEIAALGRLGGAAIDELLAKLADPDAVVRRMAARALGAIGDEKVVGKPAATAVLEDLTARAVGPLTSALDDTDELVRGAAGSALWSLGAGDLLGARQAALHDEIEPMLLAAGLFSAVVKDLDPALRRAVGELDSDLLLRVVGLPDTVGLGRQFSFDDPTEMTFSYADAKRLASEELKRRRVLT